MKSFKQLLGWIITKKLKNDFQNQVFKKFNERPVEFAFVFRMLAKYYPKKVLDVGTGTTALPHLVKNCGMLVTAIDNVKDYWPKGMFNRHYYVMNDNILKPTHNSKYDMVLCVSVLEHIENYELAVENMANFLETDGVLIMTFPSSPYEYVKNCYSLNDSTYSKRKPYIAQSFSPDIIKNWCSKYGLEEIETEYWQFWSGEYWTCGDKIIPPIKKRSDESYQIRCLCLRKSKG